MAGSVYPVWVGIAAATSMLLLGGHSSLLLIAEAKVDRRRERVQGSLDTFDVETVGVKFGSRTRARVNYFYQYNGEQFRSTHISVLDITPIRWAVNQDDLLMRLREVFKNRAPLTIYIDPLNPHDSVLVQYSLQAYLWRSVFWFLLGVATWGYCLLSGTPILTLKMMIGIALGLSGYIYAVLRK